MSGESAWMFDQPTGGTAPDGDSAVMFWACPIWALAIFFSFHLDEQNKTKQRQIIIHFCKNR